MYGECIYINFIFRFVWKERRRAKVFSLTLKTKKEKIQEIFVQNIYYTHTITHVRFCSTVKCNQIPRKQNWIITFVFCESLSLAIISFVMMSRWPTFYYRSSLLYCFFFFSYIYIYKCCASGRFNHFHYVNSYPLNNYSKIMCLQIIAIHFI